MEKLLSNQAVELYINENYLSKLNNYLREVVELVNVFFVKGNGNSQEGTYVYTNEKGYNYLFTEKGKVQKHEVTMELFQIVYWVMDKVVFSAALKYATENRVQNRDFRRILFEKEKELWNILDKKGYEMKCAEIQEILRENPFIDE